jgi:Tfp pilus assembly protein PilF
METTVGEVQDFPPAVCSPWVGSALTFIENAQLVFVRLGLEDEAMELYSQNLPNSRSKAKTPAPISTVSSSKNSATSSRCFGSVDVLALHLVASP